MFGNSNGAGRTNGSTRQRSKYSAPIPRTSSRDNNSASSDRRKPTSESSSAEQFKFLPGNYHQIRIRENFTAVEATKPSSNFVYLARSLTNGKRFCVSANKVANDHRSDFSFIIGFTSCSPASLLNNAQHSTVQCSPTGCGGHSQQVKIYNANRIGSKVTVERQSDGEVYFAIDSSMPIRIQFDRNSCGINLVGKDLLTPYIQLSGNVLAVATGRNVRKLNIRSALGTATAYGPPTHKKTSSATGIIGEAHQAFVASSDADTKFIGLTYPRNDVKVSVNRMAVLRKNERGEGFVFYMDKIINLNARVTVQVTKIYDAGKYTSDFEFGLTTIRSEHIEMLEELYLKDSFIVRAASTRLKIHQNSKVNDKYTFTRTGEGAIEIKKNDIVCKMWKIDREFMRTKNLLPCVILNGSVSGLIIINNDAFLEFGHMEYEWPPMDIKTTNNVQLTNETLLTWSQNSKDGVIVNAKPFENMIKFIIREIRTSINGQSLTFGLINSTNIGFKTPRDMSTCLDFQHDNLIQAPALGLKFSLYKTPYGKVTLKCYNGHSDPTTLFTVEPSHQFYPIFILNGSVVAIELLPNPVKTTVKRVPCATTSRPQPPPTSTSTDDCKICMDRLINSVFVPCGHRFACVDCGQDWMRNVSETCPVCRKKIDKLLKTFD